MAKQRLDRLLAQRGLFPSRSRAAASVMAGEVRVGSAARRAEKPGELIDVDAPLAVEDRPRYVSRGGIKLANALGQAAVAVAGRHAIDVGASSGGFTDCLLQHGASEVIAVDVAYGLLDYRLRQDPRVLVMERTNARSLTPEELPYLPELAVIDVSFIGLAKVLPAVIGCMAPRHEILALIKPQFELGRGRVGKGGVVRPAADRREALENVGAVALGLGEAVLGFHSSGLPGPKGNRESFIVLAEHGRPGGARGELDLDRMVRMVEP
jgi:23S rRNA (cytidine1920-2'-O)/16S rRNA (cytidine1409-2'-O)-methyltransferase